MFLLFPKSFWPLFWSVYDQFIYEASEHSFFLNNAKKYDLIKLVII